MFRVYQDGSFKIPNCDAVFSIIDTRVGGIIITRYIDGVTGKVRTAVLANDTNSTNYDALANILLDMYDLGKDTKFYVSDELASIGKPYKCRVEINLELDLEHIYARDDSDLIGQVSAELETAIYGRFVDSVNCDMFVRNYSEEISNAETLN